LGCRVPLDRLEEFTENAPLTVIKAFDASLDMPMSPAYWYTFRCGYCGVLW